VKEERLIDQIAEAIGPEAHAALLAELGGRRLVIPKKIVPITLGRRDRSGGSSYPISAEFAGATLHLPGNVKKRALIIDALIRPNDVLPKLSLDYTPVWIADLRRGCSPRAT